MSSLPVWIQRRIALIYMLLGAIVLSIVFADYRALTYKSSASTTARTTATRVVDQRLKTALGNQNVVEICETDIASAIAQNGATVTGFRAPTVALGKNDSVRVSLIIDAPAPFGGPGHCVLSKGLYQATEVGPGA